MAKERDLEYELAPSGLRGEARAYWGEALFAHEMTWAQIDLLLEQPGVRFHELIEMLEAGCPPELAFDIVSDQPRGLAD